MTIRELIEKVGSDNIQVQFLHECIVGAQSTKRGTHVTFGTLAITTHELATEEFKNVGVILWIPREKWPSPKSTEHEDTKI